MQNHKKQCCTIIATVAPPSKTGLKKANTINVIIIMTKDWVPVANELRYLLTYVVYCKKTRIITWILFTCFSYRLESTLLIFCTKVQSCTNIGISVCLLSCTFRLGCGVAQSKDDWSFVVSCHRLDDFWCKSSRYSCGTCNISWSEYTV